MQQLEKKQCASLGGSPERALRAVLSKKDQEHTRLGYFKKGVLVVEVDSSSRLYLLNLHKQDLLEKLRKKLSGVKDIRFRLGELE